MRSTCEYNTITGVNNSNIKLSLVPNRQNTATPDILTFHLVYYSIKIFNYESWTFKMLSNLANVFQCLLIAASPLTNIHGGEHSDGPKRGAVASEKRICSEIGIKLMKDGGNAVDALVGTVFCVRTVIIYYSSISGGGFVLLRMPDRIYKSVDF